VTSQPKWRCVAQLGDADPIGYGGLWVFVDDTGVYPPEIEVFEDWGDDEGRKRNEVYRVVLDPHTYINGILSDNPFHPAYPVWYADDIEAICQSMDSSPTRLIAYLCSDEPVLRAMAYQEIAGHFGWGEFDHYPLQLTRTEAKRRFKAKKYRVDPSYKVIGIE
jgi:hypothetical protein